MAKPLTVLHLPTAAKPWVVGGRETYSRSLADQLQLRGWSNHIAFHQNPNVGEPLGIHPTDTGPTIHVLPGLGEISRRDVYRCRTAATPGFAELLEQLRPDVVHLQDFSPTVSLTHLEHVKARRIKVLMSYHSPGQSCLQRELLYKGTTVCDGEILLDRCTACRLAVQGVPGWVRWPLAKLTWPNLGTGRLQRALTARTMTEEFAQAWSEMVQQVDRLHIHAEWCRDVMLRNGVPEEKLVLYRLGLPLTPAPLSPRPPRRGDEPLRLLMIGRCERVKGQAILIEAVKGLPPEIPVEVSFIGPYWDATEYGRHCLNLVAGDSRFLPPRQVPHAEIPSVLGAADVLVVPSLWLETGPLVVMESFACGVPVVGSNLGGIAELVQHDENGLLFIPHDAASLRAAISKLATQPATYDRLRRGIKPPRTMREVAADAESVYRELLRR